MRKQDLGSARRLIGALVGAVVVLLARAPVVQAISETEKTFLHLYFSEDELQVVSATRSPQSIARVAENIEVVTAEDIELMNAHTLADVLHAVNGTQVDFSGGFGAQALPDIQGAEYTRVTVLMNGVPLQNLASSAADVGFFPVQDIEKVEIIKGPASAAWGSALGGVVNIITRGPGSTPLQGSASISYGTGNSTDYRAAISGRTGRLGYRLSGTGLKTDGLTEGFDNDAGYLGAAAEYRLSGRAEVSFRLLYGDAARGDGAYPADDVLFGNHFRHLVSSLALGASTGQTGRVHLSLWTTIFDDSYFMRQISDDAELFHATLEERRSGASLSHAWSHGVQDFVAGADYSSGTLKSSDIPGAELEQRQWAVFFNDTVRLGGWTIAPGLRYDDNSTSDNFWSPSLGVTYAVGRNALARATVARGFNLPTLTGTSGTSDINMFLGNPALAVEKVWSYQAGLEANILDSFWLKASAFRHDLEDVIDDVRLEDPPGWWTVVNKGRQRRLGVELAARTRPYRHTTLAGNAFFMKTEDLETHEDVPGIPRRIFDLSVKYDDERSFRALLQGRYAYTVEPEDYHANLGGFIFDLNLMRRFSIGPGAALEAFLSLHNIFDGAQYYVDIYKNPGRWCEAGVRLRF
ncbi:MAG TPA: TonB-dependent receptor [Candidatus Methanoperedens sp.]|nr:TonB-dependent receptor [Candidatus Methanoperedens sp.]